jgi:hypothetical protein
MNKGRGCSALFLGICLLVLLACGGDGSGESTVEPYKWGNSAKTGGSPTIRHPCVPESDDPETSNDESNDQPVGHFGTITLDAHNISSGNSYPLDADVNGFDVERIYFERGGWVDFYSCELDDDYSGYCTDENGNDWEFQGEW